MGLTPLARQLADAGAPVSTCTATLLGMEDRVRRMIAEDGACVRERGAHDIPIIAYTACGEEHAGIADFLLSHGADVRAKSLGLPVLHVAASKGYVRLAEVLLGHGAEVNTTAVYKGKETTPLGIAMAVNQSAMVDFLRGRGGRS
jgi:hypothetical protein